MQKRETTKNIWIISSSPRKFIKVKQCEKILRLWLRDLFVSGFVTDRAGKRVQMRHTFSL